MGKTKTEKSSAAGKAGKDSQVKPLNSVKSGGVTKPSQTPKALSKTLAKDVAGKVEKAAKKTKKAVKEPTPESSSEEEEAETSESSESSEAESDSGSDSGSEVEDVKPKTNGAAKVNGVAKPKVNGHAAPAQAEEESDSESDSESDDEEAPVVKAAAAKAEESGSDSNSSEESDSDEEEKPKSAVVAKAVNGTSKKAKSEEESSAEDSDDSSEDSSEEEEEKDEEVPAKNKRKAEPEATPVAKKTKTEVDSGNEGIKNLFVGNLSWKVDEDSLTREFESFGELTGVRVMTDRDTGRSKGFGYVEFANAEDAAKAHAQMSGASIDGRTINLDFAKPRDNANGTPQNKSRDRANRFGDQISEPNETLFVGNISFDANEDSIGEAFGEYGTITRVSLPTDMETGVMKGYGYVQFSTLEEAKAAFENMQGAEIAGRAVRLDYGKPKASGDNQRGGFGGGRGGGRGRGGFGGGFGGRGGRGGGDRGRGGRGGGRGGRGGSTNRGGFGDFKGSKMTF